MPANKPFIAHRTRPSAADTPVTPANIDYWRGLGFEAEQAGPIVVVTLPSGTRLEDHGDSLILDRHGEPTDEEIRVMVAAAKERGWTGIRFSGSEAFQQRARLEALRQGYQLDQISLECEDGKKPPASSSMPMPDHIRRRLTPPAPPEEAPALEATPAPQGPVAPVHAP